MMKLIWIPLVFFPFIVGCSDTTVDTSNELLKNSGNVEHDFSPKGCEYIVTFPMKPQYKEISPESSSTVTATSSLEDGLPSLRADCSTENTASHYTKEDILKILEIQAKSSSLNNIKLTVEDTNVGRIGTYKGEIEGPTGPFILTGILYLGERSSLNIIISERLDEHPSSRTLEFIDSVRR